jgi:nuclear protein localization protein 4 homolog
MILRLRSPSGQFRIEIDPEQPQTRLLETIQKKLGYHTLNFSVSTDANGQNTLLIDPNSSIETLDLKNGDFLFTTLKEQSHVVSKAIKPRYIKQHKVDEILLKEKGTIKRPRNPAFCKHGDLGMCEYCLPLQPYDAAYLEENKIKHMSFHAYLRRIIETEKVLPPSSDHFIPPLEIPNYSILDPCPSKSHDKYPNGICSKCQPSAITLQTQVFNYLIQNFRMVDHVEFENPSIIDNFISYWRSTGTQRAGYLFGRYETYENVPLGVKAIVSVIFEPPQESGHDYIQLHTDFQLNPIIELASKLNLELVGIVYSDLTDDGSRTGKVVCKRHGQSYFLSSAEIIFSARIQSQYPIKTPYSPTGEYGSRFVTCVISGIFILKR